MKVFVLIRDFGPYDGGIEMVGIFSTYAKAEEAHNSGSETLPLVTLPLQNHSITDMVCYIDEWTIDEV